jgi:hypothetical protein
MLDAFNDRPPARPRAGGRRFVGKARVDMSQSGKAHRFTDYKTLKRAKP